MDHMLGVIGIHNTLINKLIILSHKLAKIRMIVGGMVLILSITNG